LGDGPGDYELCPVCFWEDDPDQLRWPLSADGANGIALVEAQQSYQRIGSVGSTFRSKVRAPRPDEPRDEGWRPLDVTGDWVESVVPDPDDATWPRDLSSLYWWRPTYWNGVPANGSIPNPELTAADELVLRLLSRVPEVAGMLARVERQYAWLPPFVVFNRLKSLAADAYHAGQVDLMHRLLDVLNSGITDSDSFAHNCVAVAFLGDETWHSPEMAAFIEQWPPELKAEHSARSPTQVRWAATSTARSDSLGSTQALRRCGPRHTALTSARSSPGFGT
jgi:Cysteine-rich CPCC